MPSMIRTLASRRWSTLALTLAAALALPAAFAQNQPPPRAGHHGDHTAPMQRTEPPVNDTSGADARTPPPSDAIGPAAFAELDANGDQKISRDEAAMDARLAANFSVHDLDRDGYLSLSEYQAGQNKGSGDR